MIDLKFELGSILKDSSAKNIRIEPIFAIKYRYKQFKWGRVSIDDDH